MEVRDPAALRAVERIPFDGYAIRRARLVLDPDPERVIACVALLGAMVVTGVLLGRASPTRAA